MSPVETNGYYDFRIVTFVFLFSSMFASQISINFRKFVLLSSSSASRVYMFSAGYVVSSLKAESRTRMRPTNRKVRKVNERANEDVRDRSVYMIDAVARISSVLRYHPWDYAQEQLQNSCMKWDSFTVNKVLKTHPPMEKAWLFFNWASRQRGFMHDQYTYTTMLDIFGEAGRISSMNYVFQQMLEQGVKADAATYTSLMHWHSNVGDTEGAEKAWIDMKHRGCRPTVISYTAYMKILFDNKKPKEACDIYKQMLRCGLFPNCCTYTVLMDYLTTCGKFKEVLEIFNKMQEAGVLPDKATCNILVEKFSNSGEARAIIKILQYMKEKRVVLRYPVFLEAWKTLRNCKEDDSLLREVNPHFFNDPGKTRLDVTSGKAGFLASMGGLIRAERFAEVVQMAEEMVKAGYSLGRYHGAQLVRRLGRANQMSCAERVFDLLRDDERSVTTYTALISAYICVGNVDKGLEVLERMRESGINPVLGTYYVLLEACGNVEGIYGLRKEKKHLENHRYSKEGLPMEDRVCNLLFCGDVVS